MDADVLIVGGGVAGLSLAYALAGGRRVILVEAEASLGHHSSGRSASFSHFGIGNRIVRALTAHSRAFFQSPPPGFGAAPVARRAPALFIATEAMLPTLEQLYADMAVFAPSLSSVNEEELATLVPILRTGSGAILAGLLDSGGLKLDSDAMLQGYAKAARDAGAVLATGCRIESLDLVEGRWRLRGGRGESFDAPVIVNAAGAWADAVAAAAGLMPLGLQPLRRTAMVIDPPEGTDVRAWPFVKTAVDDFYMLPEGGKLIASPVDEIPDAPGDAQPEEIDIARAAAKVEEYTSLQLRRIGHRWAGLRTFVPDRTPVVGFDPRAAGFFWLGGQGGFGLQTAPALAAAAAALLLDEEWPQALAASGVHAHDLAPERLIHGS